MEGDEQGRFLAIINTPGYLSEQDEVPEFETAREAWRYLRDERDRDVDAMGDPDETDRCWLELDTAVHNGFGPGTVYGATPGYEGEHDLGLAYSVVRTSLGAPL